MAATKPNLPTAAPAIPKRLVQTNVFSTGSSATPTMAAAPQKVQTGGFGDPNGVPAQGQQQRQACQYRAARIVRSAGGSRIWKRHRVARKARAAWSRARDLETGLLLEMAAAGSTRRGATASSGRLVSEMLMPLAVQTVSAQRWPRLLLASFLRKFLSKPTPAYTDEARKAESKAKFFSKLCWKLPEKFACCAWCAAWVTDWMSLRSARPSKSISSRRCGMASPRIPRPCYILFSSWPEATTLMKGSNAQSESGLVPSFRGVRFRFGAGGSECDLAGIGLRHHDAGNGDPVTRRHQLRRPLPLSIRSLTASSSASTSLSPRCGTCIRWSRPTSRT